VLLHSLIRYFGPICGYCLLSLDLLNFDAIDTDTGSCDHFREGINIHAFDEHWFAIGVEEELSVGQLAVVFLFVVSLTTRCVLSLLLLKLLHLHCHSFCQYRLLDLLTRHFLLLTLNELS
jgi:hypothetical protein